MLLKELKPEFVDEEVGEVVELVLVVELVDVVFVYNSRKPPSLIRVIMHGHFWEQSSFWERRETSSSFASREVELPT